MDPSKREQALAKLYQRLHDRKHGRRKRALFQLTKLVMNSHPVEGDSFRYYEEEDFMFDMHMAGVSPELRLILLDRAELQFVADELFRLIEKRPISREQAFDVLGYMEREHALQRTLDFLRSADDRLDTRIARSICEAFHTWLQEEETAPLTSAEVDDIRSWLEKWAGARSRDLAEKAEVVLEVLDEEVPAPEAPIPPDESLSDA